MVKKNKTSKALTLSIVAMILCVAMLAGTTFAWFTDNAASANNIIKSGNLDIELEYLNGSTWEKVTDTTNVFEKNTLWEPGHTEVVYLKISNLGTLALKYQLGINIVNEVESFNVNGGVLRLSDYIEFVAIDDVETAYADRATAREAARKAAEDAQTDPAILSTGYTKPGEMEAGDPAEYVALVVYMPENIGNEANYRAGEVAPEIQLGIKLMATQYTSEKDSFDNGYDDGAKYGGVPTARVTVLAEMPTVTIYDDDGNEEKVTLDTAYVFNTTEDYNHAQLNAHHYWHADFVATFDRDVDGSKMGLAGQYDTFGEDWLAFTLEDVGYIPANTPVRMLINEDIGTNIPINYDELCDWVKEFSCGAFAVDHEAMGGTTMTVELRLYETTIDPNANSGGANVETGKSITIGTYSYTFPLVKTVSDAAGLLEALNDPHVTDIKIDADIITTNPVELKDVEKKNIDVNGHNVELTVNGEVKNVTVTGINDSKDATPALTITSAAKGELTVKDSYFYDENSQPYGAIAGNGTSTELSLNIDGCTIEGARPLYLTNMNNLTVTNTTFKGVTGGSWAIILNGTVTGNIVIDGCTFENCTGILKAGVSGDKDWQTGKTGNVTFTNNVLNDNNLKDGTFFATNSAGTVTVSGNTGNTTESAGWNNGLN